MRAGREPPRPVSGVLRREAAGPQRREGPPGPGARRAAAGPLPRRGRVCAAGTALLRVAGCSPFAPGFLPELPLNDSPAQAAAAGGAKELTPVRCGAARRGRGGRGRRGALPRAPSLYEPSARGRLLGARRGDEAEMAPAALRAERAALVRGKALPPARPRCSVPGVVQPSPWQARRGGAVGAALARSATGPGGCVAALPAAPSPLPPPGSPCSRSGFLRRGCKVSAGLRRGGHLPVPARRRPEGARPCAASQGWSWSHRASPPLWSCRRQHGRVCPHQHSSKKEDPDSRRAAVDLLVPPAG